MLRLLRILRTHLRGAIDLASIMVGVIVIALVAGALAATVFAVIPWTQDESAKQNLDAVRVAEKAAHLPDPTKPGTGKYAPKPYNDTGALPGTLVSLGFLPTDPKSLVAATGATKDCYVGVSRSATDNLYWIDSYTAQVHDWRTDKVTACDADLPGLINTIPLNSAPPAFTQLTLDTRSAPIGAWSATASTSDGATVVATLDNGNLYSSTDQGTTWAPFTGSGTHVWSTVSISSDGKLIAAGTTTESLYVSKDSGKNWSTTSAGNAGWKRVSATSDGVINAIPAVGTGPQTRSTDFGATWVSGPTEKSYVDVDVSADGKTVLAADKPGDLWVSTDGGWNYTQHRIGGAAANWSRVSVSPDGTWMVAGQQPGGLYQSSDSGNTWASVTGPAEPGWAEVVASDDGSAHAIGTNGPKYSTSGKSNSWTADAVVTNTSNWANVVASDDGKKVLANAAFGTAAGAYLTVNGGAPTRVTSKACRNLAISGNGNRMFCLTYSSSWVLWASSDNGATWPQSTAINISTSTNSSMDTNYTGDIATFTPWDGSSPQYARTIPFDGTTLGAWTTLVDSASQRVAVAMDNTGLVYSVSGSYGIGVPKNISKQATLGGALGLIGIPGDVDTMSASDTGNAIAAASYIRNSEVYISFDHGITWQYKATQPAVTMAPDGQSMVTGTSGTNMYMWANNFTLMVASPNLVGSYSGTPLLGISKDGTTVTEIRKNNSTTMNLNRITFDHTTDTWAAAWDRSGGYSGYVTGLNYLPSGASIFTTKPAGVTGQIWIQDGGAAFTNMKQSLRSSGPPAGTWSSVTVSTDGQTIAAVTGSLSMYVSEDSGATWFNRTTSSPRNVAFSGDGTKLFMTMSGAYAYVSTDKGVNWTASTFLLTGDQLIASDRTGSVVYFARSDSGGTGNIVKATLTGTTWSATTTATVGAGGRRWSGLSASDDGLVVTATVNGAGNNLWGSIDGINFAAKGATATRNGVAVARGTGATQYSTIPGGKLQSTVSTGTTWADTAGASWTYAFSGIGVSDDGKKAVAVSTDGHIVHTVDGLGWSNRDEPGSWSQVGMSGDGATFTVVGAAGLKTFHWNK